MSWFSKLGDKIGDGFRSVGNFAENVWDKGKKEIVAGVGVVGTAVGTAIGFPALGGVAAGALNMIPTKTQEKMKQKIKQQGVIKLQKLEQTMVKNGVQPTTSNVQQFKEVIQKQVEKETGKKPAVAEDGAGTQKWYKKAFNFVKNYWYAFVGGGVVLIGGYLLYNSNKPKNYRRR